MTPPLPTTVAQAWQLHQSGRLQEAESAYRAIIAKYPADIDATLRLAFLQRQTGRADQAVTILQTLFPKHPNHPGIAGELASAYLGNGNFAKAQSIFEALIKAKPDFLPAHIGLAQSYLARQRTKMAVQSLTQANKLIPNNPDILHELGLAYLQNGQPNKAVVNLEASYRINPASPRIHKSLGNILHLVGRLDEAKTHLEKALQQMPADPSVAVYLYELYQSLGLLEDAEKIIMQRINKSAPHPALLLAAARISRRKSDDQKALHYLQLIINNQSQIPLQLRASALFELAAVLENLGEYERAFKNYAQANHSLNYKYNHDAAVRHVDALINAYTTENIKKMFRATNNSQLPIFILGMPRSGTTLIEQIIGSHSQAFGAGELPHLGQTCSSLLADQRKTTARDWNPAGMMTASVADLNRGADQYLKNIRPLDPEAQRITDKMPPNFYYLGFIAQILPHAHIIHCKRQPLDTCLSIFATPLGPAHQYSTNLSSIGQYYREYQRLMNHWRKVTNDLGTPYTEIQYESVIEEPEKQIRQLIQFCGLDWQDQCLNFHESKRSVATASVHQVRKPIYRTSVHRYKNFEQHLAPLYETLGDILP